MPITRMGVIVKHVRLNLVAGAVSILLCAMVVGSVVRSRAQVSEGGFGVGIPDGFLRKYAAFRAGQIASGARHMLRVQLGYVKGLSRSFTSMAGEFAVNLDSGAFRLSLNGLTPSQTYGVWLVDAVETTGTQAASDTVVGTRLRSIHWDLRYRDRCARPHSSQPARRLHDRPRRRGGRHRVASRAVGRQAP